MRSGTIQPSVRKDIRAELYSHHFVIHLHNNPCHPATNAFLVLFVVAEDFHGVTHLKIMRNARSLHKGILRRQTQALRLGHFTITTGRRDTRRLKFYSPRALFQRTYFCCRDLVFDFACLAGFDFSPTCSLGFCLTFGFCFCFCNHEHLIFQFYNFMMATSCHFIGNILLKTLTHTLKWNALEDRVKETLHNDLLSFSLGDAA